MLPAIIFFAITYVLMISFGKYRPYIALTSGLLFIDSHMPERMADMIMNKVPNVQWAAVSLSLFSGIISAFVDNVATVLMIAPVAIEICRKLKTNPISFTLSAIVPAYILIWILFGV